MSILGLDTSGIFSSGELCVDGNRLTIHCTGRLTPPVSGKAVSRNGLMTKEELRERLAELYKENYSHLGALQRTQRMYPPDGGGHGYRWRERMRKNDELIAELEERVRLSEEEDEGEVEVELYSDAHFAQTRIVLVPAFDEITCEVLEYFARNPAELERLHWRKLEELLDSVFRNQGFYTEIGPGNGDDGVDLRLVQKDTIGEIVTLVQAKRYASKYPVHLEAVQALSAVVDHNKANRGLFVTTSRYLPSTQRFAEAQRGKLVLAQSEDVSRWCRKALHGGRSNLCESG